MANPIKGEIAFSSNDEEYTLVLGTYGLAAAERHLGRGLPGLMQAGDIGFDVILAVFYGGLLKHHQLTLPEAGDVVDGLGFERASELMVEAVTLAFPKAAKNPRKAAKATGIGKAS